MALIIEDGTGVVNANSWTDRDFALQYLTDRGRQAENGWDTASTADQDAKLITAADFIEQRWGQRFIGRKEFLDLSTARATLTLTGQPADTETVAIGSTTYTFNTALGAANSVLIGASVAESIDNLVSAITAVEADEGVLYGVGTVQNAEATAAAGLNDTMVAESRENGTAGNSVTVSTTVTGASWSSATLVGGGDVQVPQPLSFPRVSLVDKDGVHVRGIPSKLQFAQVEYAVRAQGSVLMPDPVIDPTGRTVTGIREKVGPIEEETKYADSSVIQWIIRPYPGADRYLQDYVFPAGRVFRG